MIVRCIDNTLQRDVLVVGREYEVRAERDDCYILSGFDKGFQQDAIPGRNTVTAATADLAAKPLRCRSCGHRQPFAPEVIARARRRPNFPALGSKLSKLAT